MDLALIEECAPNVAPQMIQQIIKVESNGNPFAIGVNRVRGKKQLKAIKFVMPKTNPEAVELARRYIDAGYNIDMGLMQINSANLRKLKISVNDIFDQCTNIKAGAYILSENYARSSKAFGAGQIALQAALSAYNTGNYSDGFSNGYVKKYLDKSPVYLDTDTEVKFTSSREKEVDNDSNESDTEIKFKAN